METGTIGPDLGKSALIVVDMQNDFLHIGMGTSAIALKNILKPRLTCRF